MRPITGALLLGLCFGLIESVTESKAAEPAPKTTVLGTAFAVDPVFEQAIAGNIAKVRNELRVQRQGGKLIAYISTPITTRGGGHEAVNLEIAAHVKRRLETLFGDRLYGLDPGQFQIPKVQNQEAQGGEYLYMWTEILAGEDGKAADFDMAYFVGPSDVRAFFGPGSQAILPTIDRFVTQRAVSDSAFRQEVADDPQRRLAFLRFYGMRANAAFSKGAHDEWNVFVRINRRRGVGEQVAMWFDGRPLSPPEMEVEVLPGYELRLPNKQQGSRIDP